MESLEKKYTDLLKALESFEVVISFRDRSFKNQDLTNAKNLELFCITRDSIIQRFEYCYELCWHYLALYLESKHAITLEFKTPAYVFRSACEAGLIEPYEAEEALIMAKMRNKTSHIYKEEIADYVANAAAGHLTLIKRFVMRFKP
ncbi:DUF86 domain-containing protein [Candidatus Dependentiae bacterium]|nr:DUF86 domain-containing protein [Candidatus Dependentiae bacterium]